SRVARLSPARGVCRAAISPSSRNTGMTGRESLNHIRHGNKPAECEGNRTIQPLARLHSARKSYWDGCSGALGPIPAGMTLVENLRPAFLHRPFSFLNSKVLILRTKAAPERYERASAEGRRCRG